MIELLSTDIFITLAFFSIAFVYASVGLGGGSSYAALMVILGYSAVVIPALSLFLNILVAGIGLINYGRSAHANVRLVWPFLISSLPMAYFAGTLSIPESIVFSVLFASLCLVALLIYTRPVNRPLFRIGNSARIGLSIAVGGVLGIAAGVAGIGGGIYIIPLIILFGLGSQKEAAFCGVLFVFLNSLFGFAARMQYNSISFDEHIPTVIAVIVGGAAGSYLGSFRFAPRAMEKIMGVIILLAIASLGRRILLG